MDNDIQKLTKKYEERLAKAQDDFDIANTELQMIQQNFEHKKAEIVAYWQAKSDKVMIDSIVANPPII